MIEDLLCNTLSRILVRQGKKTGWADGWIPSLSAVAVGTTVVPYDCEIMVAQGIFATLAEASWVAGRIKEMGYQHVYVYDQHKKTRWEKIAREKDSGQAASTAQAFEVDTSRNTKH